jgi:hypothetical protein
LVAQIRELGFACQSGSRLTVTFVIDSDEKLRIADRHSEHVALANTGDVLAAGEMTFSWDLGLVAVESVTNQSTGYCPDTDSWLSVDSALKALALRHPETFEPTCVFRRRPKCGQTNIVKDNWFVCSLCSAALPPKWNYARRQ